MRKRAAASLHDTDHVCELQMNTEPCHSNASAATQVRQAHVTTEQSLAPLGLSTVWADADRILSLNDDLSPVRMRQRTECRPSATLCINLRCPLHLNNADTTPALLFHAGWVQ